ncbi:ABC transporter ATP-binding protein [Nocardia macrotermitis]|uniref:Fe(3+) dicitrate transport ATP-binding protein FecE n=1 Tax=Nocardia macrotermitis TaxID=2585198 RepID=A0A7K0D0A0_9NOCA|nr:ABC transporter ATP-binding protein [Nocardia macrotermitis]MQY19155.1 Fe(3+) dicitrate transport ATP-binding protein FecE [Nocardia macrotermitis]
MTLTVENLDFAHGRTPVLRSISLPEFEPGAMYAVVGPNGAGKSTLLRCIAGLHRHSGTVRLGDGTVAGQPGSVLYLPQDPPPATTLTVFENVLLAYQQGAGFRVERATVDLVSEVLTRVGLTAVAGRRMAQLSGGQQQLVSLAQAIVRRPSVLLLDEPTSSLDLHNQLKMLELVRQYAREQPAVVLTTIHDLTHAARFAERVVVLRDGGVHVVGTPREVITEDMLRQVYRVNARIHFSDDDTLALAATSAYNTDI